MATLSEERVDHLTARATCEVTFPADASTPFATQAGPTINIGFRQAARGCSSRALAFDEARDRNVSELHSVLTWFHADDDRPAWLRGVETLAGGATPAELPRPVRGLAARLLGRYGPGSITVSNDPDRPITGELIAGEPGPDGELFPADSYFDQYLLVRVGGRTFTHDQPLRVSAKVNSWPPAGEHYKSEGATDFHEVGATDGQVAFRFGNCNIDILQHLSETDLRAIQESIATIHGEPSPGG
jgi:hypothetical protein